MDITLAILIALIQTALAGLAFFEAVKDPKAKRHKRIYLATFIVLAIVGVLGAAFQQYRTQSKIENEQTLRKEQREILGNFMLEGQEIQHNCANEQVPPPDAEANVWAEKIEKYLALHLDSSYVARFRSGAGLPLTANSITSIPHRNLWAAIYIRVARLQQFIETAN